MWARCGLGTGLVWAWCGLGVTLVRAWCVGTWCRGSVGKFFIQKSLPTLFDSMGPVVGSLEFHISHRIDLVVGLQWDSSMYLLYHALSSVLTLGILMYYSI